MLREDEHHNSACLIKATRHYLTILNVLILALEVCIV